MGSCQKKYTYGRRTLGPTSRFVSISLLLSQMSPDIQSCLSSPNLLINLVFFLWGFLCTAYYIYLVACLLARIVCLPGKKQPRMPLLIYLWLGAVTFLCLSGVSLILLTDSQLSHQLWVFSRLRLLRQELVDFESGPGQAFSHLQPLAMKPF